MFSICTMKKTQATTTTPFISRPSNQKPRNNTLLQVAPASIYLCSALSTHGLGQRSFVYKSTGSSSSLVRCSSESAVSGEDDHRALETVLKLYKAIKHRNLREMSDVIGDECRCVCNFVSFLHLFHGKKQVLEFFSYLLASLGKNVEIVVRPTLNDGLNVGVSWRLEWKTTQIPLGKGISFHTMHIYQGKVMIKSIEMFMEPLLNIEPLRLKLMGHVMSLLDRFGSNVINKGKGWKLLYIIILTLLILLIFALLVHFRDFWF